MKIWPVIACIIFATSVRAQTPCAGMQTRSIKALSGQQVADLSTGAILTPSLFEYAELRGYGHPHRH
jgi:hypothetical protein